MYIQYKTYILNHISNSVRTDRLFHLGILAAPLLHDDEMGRHRPSTPHTFSECRLAVRCCVVVGSVLYCKATIQDSSVQYIAVRDIDRTLFFDAAGLQFPSSYST
jgi:hypothetical protein